MARKRPIASNAPPVLVCLDGSRPDNDGMLLTRAEADALRRSAPRTHQELKAYLEAVRDPRLRGV